MRFSGRIMQPGQGVRAVRLEALDLDEAKARLIQDGATVLSLRADGLAVPLTSGARFSVPLFTQELVALLEAGLTLGEGLDVLAEKESRSEARQLLERLLDALRQGRPFSEALAAQPDVFSPLYAATVRSAEKTGDLAPALTRYLAYHRRVDALRKQVVSALIYPVLLMIVGSLVIGFLLTYVVPRFATVYANAGRTPPWATQVLLTLGTAITQHGTLLAVVLAAVIVGLITLLRRPEVRARLGALAWRLPGVGEPLRVFQLARFYRSLGMLLDGGIPIVAALDTVSPLLAAPLRPGAAGAREAMRQGRSVSQALEAGGLTTPVALRLLRVGEESGGMGAMMERIARFHDETTARTVEWITRLFEPLLMVVIGLTVGGVIVLLYLPIFDLTGAFQ